MRIGIDFHSAEREGTGNCTYIRSLVEALIKADVSNEYFLYVTDLSYPYYRQFKGWGNVRLCLTRSNNPFVRIPLLGLRTFVDRIDVLHVQYIAPPFYRGKLVVMIHDVSFLHFPGCFRRFERARQRILIPKNIAKADKVLTVSKYSRDDIVRHYGISVGKVEVTYDGVKPVFKPIEDLSGAGKILKKYGVFGRFIFFLGRIDARKNVSALIKAFIFLKQKKGISQQLVIAGKKDFLPEEAQREIDASEHRKDIIFTGYLPEGYLPLFYNLADAFVYPSFYEGFGLPVLEAMACGCPVVSSNTSAIPEVVDGAGILVEPADATGISGAIYRVISDSGLMKELKEKGLKQARNFNWKDTAEKTLTVYREVLK